MPTGERLTYGEMDGRAVRLARVWPKGVMLPHRMIVWNGYNTVVGWQLREDDVSPIFTPLYHAGGLEAFLVPIVTIGGTIGPKTIRVSSSAT